MNPETALSLVAALMDKRKPSGSGRYAVVRREGQFLCLPVELVCPREVEFGRYSEDDLSKGLSIRQWSKLKIKITRCYEQKGL